MSLVRIVTNISGFNVAFHPGAVVHYTSLNRSDRVQYNIKQFISARNADFVVINNEEGLLCLFCALSLIIPRRFKLISIDVVLGVPLTFAQRLRAILVRILFKKVDLFIVYQRDLEGYHKYYGIDQDWSAYVPFKVNVWELLQRGEVSIRNGNAILFAGRTYRDIPTFFQACAISGVPAVMIRHSQRLALEHGTAIPNMDRPSNLTEIVDDDDNKSYWINMMASCRAIVIPISPSAINAAGISTMLDGLAMGKAVIITDCPATRGIVTDKEVALVPPGDASELAFAMQRVHEDDDYRMSLEAAGRKFAAELKGEKRLYDDILRVLVERFHLETSD